MSRPRRHRRRVSALVRAIEPLEPRIVLSQSFVDATTPANLSPGAGGLLYYVNDDGIHGSEIWRTDGTQAGTALLKDIAPGKVGSAPPDFDYRFRWISRRTLFTWNNATYFSADDGVHGAELWKTDGTAAGTVLLRDLNPGGFRSDPDEFVAFNGSLYFNGLTNDGDALWKTDGTAAGTVRVTNAVGGHVHGFTIVGPTLYFLVTTPSFGPELNELWKSDGTTKRTVQVSVTLPNADEGDDGVSLHNVAGQLLIVAPRTSRDRAFPDGTVWKVDTSTQKLVELLTSYELHPVANVNGKLLLAEDYASTSASYDDPAPLVLWQTDGSPAGTSILWQGPYKAHGWSPGEANFHLAGNTLYFEQRPGDDFGELLELWRTDGTAAGTKLLKHGGFETSSVAHLSQFTVLEGVTYFADGSKLWKTDGTTAGTVALADWPVIGPAYADTPARDVTAMSGRLFFVGTDDFRGADVWTYRPSSKQMLHLRSVRPEILLRRGRLGIDGSNFDDSITINVTPSAGTFTIYWDNAPSTTYKLAEVSGVSIRGLGGNDVIKINGMLPHVTIAGGAGDDVLTGGAAADLIIGESGNDNLFGDGGNDTLQGDDDNPEDTDFYGRDQLFGGDGNDVLLGGPSDDGLSGGAGDDELYGGTFDDGLSGDEGNDRLYGEAGDDRLVADAGADLLSGGDGADDVDYSARTSPLQISLDGRPHDGAAGEGDNVLPDFETVLGGGGDDLIIGTSAKDVLGGGPGNDSLYGGDGDDSLFGDDGADWIWGQAGNDAITGGMGSDVLDGGRGNDVFYCGNDEGARDYLHGGKGTDRARADRKDVQDGIESLFR